MNPNISHPSLVEPSFHERFSNINWSMFAPLDFKKPLTHEDDIHHQLIILRKQISRLVAENKSLMVYKIRWNRLNPEVKFKLS